METLEKLNRTNIIAEWNKLGISNFDDYLTFLNIIKKTVSDKNNAKTVLSLLRERFNPDSISSRDFWLAAEQVFGTDPVCNRMDNPRFGIQNVNDEFDMIESNKRNHMIPLHSGMIGYLESAIFNCKKHFNSDKVKIAEIGAGYGSLLDNFINLRDDIEYTGFDLIKRRPEIKEVKNENGYFSEEQVEQYKNEFDIFYSCNVTQHLSPHQLKTYIQQIGEMLPRGKYFLSSFTMNPSLHYGQYIIPISYNETRTTLAENGFSPVFESHVYTCPLRMYVMLLEKVKSNEEHSI